MQKTHAVIFDIDGVLLHLTPPEVDALVEAFETQAGIARHRVNTDWNTYRVLNDLDIVFEALERHFGREPTSAEFEAVLSRYIDNLTTGLRSGELNTRMVEGARSVLDALSGFATLHLGVATANIEAAAELRLRHAGLWGYYAAVGCAEAGGAKSNILRTVLATLSENGDKALPLEQVVFLGDQVSDLQAARENGVHFLGVSTDAKQRAFLREKGAETVIGDHSGTVETIRHLLRL